MKIFDLPDLGEGLPDAEIHEWQVKVGDSVKTDDPLVSMETAKAVVDVPSPCDGIIKKLYGSAGDIIKTGSPLVEFDTGEADDTSDTVVGNIIKGDSSLNETGNINYNKPGQKNIVKATPAVRALAKKLNVDLELVTPSASSGNISIVDVQNYSADNQNDLTPLTGTRRTMAQAMQKSHQEVVAVTIVEDAIFSPEHDFSNLTAQLITSIIAAIKAEPNLNSWYYGSSSNIRKFEDINLGIAMDSPAGLFVPVIRKAQELSESSIREKIATLKTLVKNREITPDDLKDPTITLSNFGTIAGKYASPIIVPPTVAIVGVGKMRDTVAVYQDKPTICKMLPISLTFDHRALTGGECARFLRVFIDSLVSP